MSKDTSIGKPFLRTIREEMNAALKSIADKHGLVMVVGKISYDTNSFKATVEAMLANKPEMKGVRPEEVPYFQGLQRDGHLYGLSVTDFKKVVSLYGEKYAFIGIKTRNRRTPLIMKKLENQKYYGFPDDEVPSLIKKSTEKEQ